MIKRLTGIAIFVLGLAQAAPAALYVDPYLGYTQTYGAKDQYGGGMNLGYQITPEFNFLFRSLYTYLTVNKGLESEETYTYGYGILGLQYQMRIPQVQLIWLTSAGIGISTSSYSSKYLENLKKTNPTVESSTMDMGPVVGLWTGVAYNWTQHISPFVELGYHQSFYANKYKDTDIMGLQVFVGIRFTLFGKNRDIFDEY